MSGENAPARANYALLTFQEFLGERAADLDVPWAEFVGDATSEKGFDVPTANPEAAYIGLQAYDVGEYGHEIEINGDPLTGFDVPPAEGWQYWMDPVTGTALREGTNAVRIVRDTATDDAFVVGTVVVHWKEPTESTQ